jgi:hypothetical protein
MEISAWRRVCFSVGFLAVAAEVVLCAIFWMHIGRDYALFARWARSVCLAFLISVVCVAAGKGPARWWLLASLLATLSARPLLAKTVPVPESAPLCELQIKAIQAEQQTVRVEGVYLEGLEGRFLVTSDCLGRSTSVEFSLKSRRVVRQLVRLSNKSNAKKHVSGDGDAVLVVFEGDFYGPRIPDPGLPDSLRKIYHPPWDNDGSFTKLIVHSIDSVKPLPPNHPCAPSAQGRWPCLTALPTVRMNLPNPIANPKP